MRQRRWTFSLTRTATALSTLLCFLAIFFGLRCYLYRDGVSYTRINAGRARSWSISTCCGSIAWMDWDEPVQARHQAGLRLSSGYEKPDSVLVRWSHYGFWRFTMIQNPDDPQSAVFTDGGVPFWFLTLITAPPPVI